MIPATLSGDPRVVLTLDAGGTNFRFSAWRGAQPVTPTVSMPARGDDLTACLADIVHGFVRIHKQCPAPPVAISFAFPGPADYPGGIIGDLVNLPAFRGGVALGPMLADRFGIPVFINNDGDLFAYGESLAGLLPQVNGLLAAAGSTRRYANLLGVTLGTGFGGGVVTAGQLLAGDNSRAAEIWLLRNKLDPGTHVEETVSIRGLRRGYAEAAGMPVRLAPDPKGLAAIARGRRKGNRAAAREAFRRFGEAAGDAIAQVLAVVDGLVVIGGGIAAAAPLFLPAMLRELNGHYGGPDGATYRRLGALALNLDAARDRRAFLQGQRTWVTVPGSRRRVAYDPANRIGVGLSRLGTSQAIALGACAFALRQLDLP